ncbi:glycerophosphodiester phosphodiesterase [Aureitalea sp. L0-47]|nr:glycerophosphodiester phosphodiesterase [Aureitalea sp. L0-47]
MPISIDLQGHRGCRGLMPENTIPGFLKTLDIGVTTLEMDLVISADKQVVVSHEPFFSHEISTAPNGEVISEENKRSYNMYQMTYDSIATFDVGLKPHSRFPKQKKMEAVKPLFLDVVKEVEHYVIQNEISKPFYNIEIKRNPKYDNIYHPNGQEFAELVVSAVAMSGVKERVVIQSFDPESLQIVRKIDPEIPLVLLIENKLTPEKNLKKLGFTPAIYSPAHVLVDASLVEFCKLNSMELIPWTVNDKDEMKRLIDLGVDGIITDYPDILNKMLDNLSATRK